MKRTHSVEENMVEARRVEPAPVRRHRWPLVALILVCLISGLALVGWGLLPRPSDQAAPLPSPFTVAPGGGRASETAPAQLAPNTLLIPSLRVRAPMIEGDLVDANGGRTLQIPGDPAKLTRYQGGATPCGSRGTVLVAGHVSSYGVRGALWPLSDIKPRAVVYLSCADGEVTTWEAVESTTSPKDRLPQDIFTDRGPLRAELITCGGPVMPDGHYRDNVRVVLARLDSGRS